MNNDVIKVQLSCGVDYYKGEKGDKPVKGVDYFTEQDINEIIERIEAGEIDLTSYATKEYVANAIEGMVVEETDPTVPEWAKAETKPSYTANEVGALPADTQLFSGNYNDLSNKPTLFSGSYNDLTNKPSLFSGNYNDLTNKPTIPSVPVNISAFYNDAGYLTTHQSLSDYATKDYVDEAVEGVVVEETDPTVPSWAKQSTKPSYTASEVGALPANTQLFSGDYDDLSNKPTLFSGNYNDLTNKPTIPVVPSNVSAFNNDAGYLTTHQSLTDYATKAYVDSVVEDINASGGITVETDPTVPSWAKQANKPTYTAQEVGALPANTELFSGDYNDLTNKPTIPTAYTLPTATTSTLGGVKVDGTTITISNGVISATPSGSSYTLPTASTSTLGGVKVDGSTITIDANGVISSSASGGGSYTAGQGISIDNGEISVDFGNEIENGCFLFTQHYDNEDYYEYTADMSPNEINLTSYGEADPETGDQETKSVSITGEGITFDDTGDSHTLGVSNGELVFDDSPIGSGGGSSYTAGDGIDIDSNGVISRDNGTYPLFGLLLNLFTDMMTAPYNQQASIRNLNLSVIGGNETVAGHIQNLKSYGMTIINKQTTANDWLQILSALDPTITSVSTQFKEFGCWSSVPSQYTLSGGNGTRSPTELAGATNGFNTILVMFDNKQSADSYFRWRFIQNPHILFQNHYFNSLQGLTSHSVAGAIDEVASNLNTRIPSAPSTDGNYVLQASVVDGAVVYDWVEVSVGGSY